jgi:hypothetical protein
MRFVSLCNPSRAAVAGIGLVDSLSWIATNTLTRLVIKTRSKRNAGIYDLVFFAVPDHRFGKLDTLRDARSGSGNFEVKDRCRNESYERMFAGVTKNIESVEGVVPSFVRLERPQYRLDFRWEVLRATPTLP